MRWRHAREAIPDVQPALPERSRAAGPAGGEDVGNWIGRRDRVDGPTKMPPEASPRGTEDRPTYRCLGPRESVIGNHVLVASQIRCNGSTGRSY